MNTGRVISIVMGIATAVLASVTTISKIQTASDQGNETIEMVSLPHDSEVSSEPIVRRLPE